MFRGFKKFVGVLSTFLLFLFIISPYLFKSVLAAPGDLDLSFGIDGKAITDFSQPGELEIAWSIVVQPDSKILVGGESYGASSPDFTLARYNPDGSLDATFGNNGRVVSDFTGYDRIFALAMQSDGKIVAGGQARVINNTDFSLARYNTDGSLDTTFGDNGLVYTIFENESVAANLRTIVIQPDGKILAGGSVWVGNDYRFAIARYNQDGSLDNSFGNNGRTTTDLAVGLYDEIFNVVLQQDGKILASGDKEITPWPTADWDFATVRYNTDGSIDQTYGSNGIVTTDFEGRGDFIMSSHITNGGKLVVTGSAYVSGLNRFAVAQYNTDGSLDTDFGINGRATTDFNENYGYANSSAITTNGNIVIVGQTGVQDSDFALAVFNSDGNLLSTFGNNGTVSTDFFTHNDVIYDVAITNNGKIIVGGSSISSNNNINFALAQYLLNANQSPTSKAGTDQTANEGQGVVFDGSGSSDPDGASDIINYNWDFGDGGTGSGVITTHTYLDNGVYTATLTVTDTANHTSTDTAQVTVNNVAPVIGTFFPISPVLPGVLVSMDASFSDPGILDTHTSAFDWGDGNVTQGAIAESEGSGSVVGSHVYSAPGTYTIILTVSDGLDAVSSSVNVIILTPAQGTQGLIDLVQTFNLQQGIENSLDVKLDAAMDAMNDLNANNNGAAINALQAFINAVEAQRGNKITNEQADALILEVQQILNAL